MADISFSMTLDLCIFQKTKHGGLAEAFLEEEGWTPSSQIFITVSVILLTSCFFKITQYSVGLSPKVPQFEIYGT